MFVGTVTKPRQAGPPSDAKFNILDRMNNFRGYITADGACYNNVGDCIGYIEEGSLEAGSPFVFFIFNVLRAILGNKNSLEK